MSMRDKAEDFILEWLKKSPVGVDILNSDFIDAFVAETGAKEHIMMWGANKCPYAAKTLNRMASEGLLTRRIIGIGSNWYPGFPKWVYTYSLARRND